MDSEAGINTAIRKIRQTLHDDPENPSFVQTVVGRGYRFCAQIEPQAEQPAIALPPTGFARSRRPLFSGGAFMSLTVVLVLFVVNARGSRDWLFGRSRLRPIHAIAVLPLDNLSGDPGEDYFVDGMTDELTTNLAKVHSLSVYLSILGDAFQTDEQAAVGNCSGSECGCHRSRFGRPRRKQRARHRTID